MPRFPLQVFVVAQKLFLRTFGCQMNEYDSAKIADVLAATEGMELTEDPEQADLILFNTCSVREKAQEKVFHDLGRARMVKAARPEVLIGVGGCVASQEGAAIIRRAPYVDLVFGPQTLHRLPELIAQRRASGRPQVDVSFPEIEKFDHLPPARVEGASAFVSIMEGCSKYCSFCVVPYTRGEEISRPFAQVLAEIEDLAARGLREVTLLGQNVNAYRGELPDGDTADLALLLEHVHALPGIGRIRFTTSHPREMSPRLIECFARLPKLASQLHLPVQSGSDRILAAMKRGYTVLEYKSIVRKLRAARPGLSLTADFIVGFPGESEADFAKTLALAEELRFDGSFNFLYSARPGTPAAELEEPVPQAVKQERFERLQAVLENTYARHSEAMVGSVQNVLVSGHAKKDAAELSGRCDNNRIVNFAGGPRLVGQFVDLRITAALPHSLRGEVLIRD
ncbi:tRNA-2-methylthio-N(6)-dimethylallyladenosine synthase [Burkholderiales bacterium]|nr:MAG: tRNA (N6-isopentenyl adenosine(37)-C2)-methylthiotransferase MiaB [Burkholderiales bacterium]CAG0954847.1 tRNA-2-methylthio-N(6)-dimethylallyladenosine synthase [Burkholderiales bacterium]